MSAETIHKSNHKDKHNLILGAQNVRNAQQRSQLYRENRIILGDKHYIDEDLLYRPTYKSLAL
jgi:hypothetical protein